MDNDPHHVFVLVEVEHKHFLYLIDECCLSTWRPEPNIFDTKLIAIENSNWSKCSQESTFQGGTLLNKKNFEYLFPFAYFDLTKQKMDIKDRVTKLASHYELSWNTAADYNIYALELHEREAEIEQQSGKLLLRA